MIAAFKTTRQHNNCITLNFMGCFPGIFDFLIWCFFEAMKLSQGAFGYLDFNIRPKQQSF